MEMATQLATAGAPSGRVKGNTDLSGLPPLALQSKRASNQREVAPLRNKRTRLDL